MRAELLLLFHRQNIHELYLGVNGGLAVMIFFFTSEEIQNFTKR